MDDGNLEEQLADDSKGGGKEGVAKLQEHARKPASSSSSSPHIHSLSSLSACLEVLSKGAKIDDKDNYGANALIFASQFGRSDIVKLLLSKGANRHVRLPDGRTCSTLAKTKEIKRLLENWEVTMAMIVLEELSVLTAIDPSSFIDLRKYMG